MSTSQRGSERSGTSLLDTAESVYDSSVSCARGGPGRRPRRRPWRRIRPPQGAASRLGGRVAARRVERVHPPTERKPMPVKTVIPILNVSDVPASFAWFEVLGWRRGFSWNANGLIDDAGDRNEHGDASFGSVGSGDATIFLCHGGQGARGARLPKFPGDDETDGVWMCWWLDDLADVDRTHAL